MKLTNQTPVPAETCLSTIEGTSISIGMVTAKATFRFDDHGRVELETQSPRPLHKTDVVTDLGVIPQDTFPRRTDVFEVMLLGAAYAPSGRQVSSMRAVLSVGDHRRAISVFGDREWSGSGTRAVANPPAPFERMPLTWENAFGGTADVYLDSANKLVIPDTWNPRGRGFDPSPWLEATKREYGAAPGFPLLADRKRALPNIENPDSLVNAWDSSPSPWCFAPIPMDVPYRMKPMHERVSANATSANDVGPQDLAALLGPEFAMQWDETFFRAHPTWRLPPLSPHARVRLEGLHRSTATIDFELPQLRVFVDYASGERTGAAELIPQQLLLLPEDGIFTISYRLPYRAPSPNQAERSMRLRLYDGWYSPGVATSAATRGSQ